MREELILPILRRLGYPASLPNQIQRSIALDHPYVYIGSQKRKISIFPDYLLTKDGKRFAVLDAKAPGENILSGKNVEQAYSYAIHKDVRASWYGLCNGKEFALFHISKWPVVLHFQLSEIENAWLSLLGILGTEAEWVNETFVPDLGIGMMILGFAGKPDKKTAILFTVIDIHMVDRVDDMHYSIQSYLEFEGTTFLGSFDFHQDLFDDFLASIHPPERRLEISNGLRAHPFSWRCEGENFALTGVACEISDFILANDNEEYIPFNVTQFMPAPDSITKQ